MSITKRQIDKAIATGTGLPVRFTAGADSGDEILLFPASYDRHIVRGSYIDGTETVMDCAFARSGLTAI